MTAAVCMAAFVTGLHSQAAFAGATVQELEKELQERDKKIDALERRLDAIEKNLSSSDRSARPAATAPMAPMAASPALAGASPASSPAAEAPVPPEAEAAAQAVLAERALERTLVRTGSTLLGRYQIEIQPEISFERQELNSPALVVNGSTITAVNQRLDRDELSYRVTARVGLPWESQFEATVGGATAHRQLQTFVGGVPTSDAKDTSTAFNLLRVGFGKTLMHEKGLRPDLIAHVRWTAPVGSTTGRNADFGGGFNRIGGDLVAIKRQDPLVFVAGVGYDHALERRGLKPGDEVSASLAVFLAVSPETSMRFGVAAKRAGEFEELGQSVPGSNQLAAVLTIGASTILGAKTLVDFALDVGLTDDAPRFGVTLAMPFQL